MRTIDFLKFYATFIWLRPGSPLIHTFAVNELTGQCRTSTAAFIRLWPLSIAVGFGQWKETGIGPHEMFRRVFSSRDVPLTGEVRRHVREVVASSALDADDEWEILQMLELDQ